MVQGILPMKCNKKCVLLVKIFLTLLASGLWLGLHPAQAQGTAVSPTNNLSSNLTTEVAMINQEMGEIKTMISQCKKDIPCLITAKNGLEFVISLTVCNQLKSAIVGYSPTPTLKWTIQPSKTAFCNLQSSDTSKEELQHIICELSQKQVVDMATAWMQAQRGGLTQGNTVPLDKIFVPIINCMQNSGSTLPTANPAPSSYDYGTKLQ